MLRFHKILLILLLSSSFFSLRAQNNYALEYYYDQWTHIEGANAEGFTGLTLEAWVNLNQYLNIPGTQYSGSFIITKEASVSNYYGFLLVVLSEFNADTGRLAFGLNFEHMGSNVHEGLHSYSKVPLKEWVHLAATWNGDSMSVFLNGVFDRSLDVSQYGGFYDPPEDSLNIGIRKVGPYLSATYGYIDEVRIWNIARTENDLRETMYTELTGNETGLFAYYKFNEGTGQPVYDSGPNGFDGYKGSSEFNNTNDPKWRSSSAPVPYYTIQDGTWDNDTTWALGQNHPVNDWSVVRIDHEVTVGNNVTTKDLTISRTGELTLDNGFTLNVNGNLLVQSDASGTGSLIDNGILNCTNEVTVERYITQKKWHFIGMPVNTDSAQVFILPGGSDIFLRSHIESSNSWSSWITDPNYELKRGKGYEVWVDDNIDQDETVLFSGQLNSGNITTGINGFYNLEYTTGHGLNLISNPYPSALVADIHNWSKTNVANSVWIWSSEAGNYLYWSGLNGTNPNGWGTLTGGVIPAMQGFFVEATGADPVLTIPQASRIHNTQAYLKSSMPLRSVKISVSGNSYRDEVCIGFSDELAQGQVKKLFGLGEAPQMYIVEEPDTLSACVFPVFEQKTEVALHFNCDTEGLFTISLNDIGEFDEATSVFLEDIQSGSFIDLLAGSGYVFSHQPGNLQNRFFLHFEKSASIERLNEIPFKISTTNQIIYVRFNEDVNYHLTLLSIDGKEISHMEKCLDQPEIQFSRLLSKGIYILKAENEDRLFAVKIPVF